MGIYQFDTSLPSAACLRVLVVAVVGLSSSARTVKHPDRLAWAVTDVDVPPSPADQDGWLGEFSGGQRYPLLWKEGEVYLLPLAEDDIGFYKAPGESGLEVIFDGKNGPGFPSLAVILLGDKSFSRC